MFVPDLKHCVSLKCLFQISGFVCHWNVCSRFQTFCVPLEYLFQISNNVCHWNVCSRSQTMCTIEMFVPDLIADTVMAKNGFPRLAISTCFGGPMFSILLTCYTPCSVRKWVWSCTTPDVLTKTRCHFTALTHAKWYACLSRAPLYDFTILSDLPNVWTLMPLKIKEPAVTTKVTTKVCYYS